MRDDREFGSVRFEPRQQASRRALILGIAIGPLLWLIALLIVASLIKRTWVIELGIVVALISFLVALALLGVLRLLRRGQEIRYARDRREEGHVDAR